MLQRFRGWVEDKRRDAHDASLLRKIAQHGWTATYVFDKRDSGHRDFAYTLGFGDVGGPELITFELDPQLINALFFQYFRYLQSGQPLVDGLAFRPGDLPGFECTLRRAVRPETWVSYVFDAIRYAHTRGRSGKPEVMQIVWPDPDSGLYPWQPGCPNETIKRQPKLYEGSPPDGAPAFEAL